MALNVADQAVQVMERLVQTTTKVIELAESLATIGEQLVDPLEDERSADSLASPSLDLLGLPICQHSSSWRR
jgi:hypothetical protein